MAVALGDPARLARELRTEAGLKRWETERNPSAAASAVFAVLGAVAESERVTKRGKVGCHSVAGT